jgi:diguanylate cyclase (GGDEF)-like protein
MKRWNEDTSLNTYLPRVVAGLARLPSGAAWLGGGVCLAVVVLLDDAARYSGLRLVPLYVPILCVICWVLGRWSAMLFAMVAAVVAILPDVLASSAPLAAATGANAAIRMASYIFLALIIVAFRRTYDEADLRAMHDGLTGVLNKMPFHAAAERQLAGARRARQTLLVACVDLDGFKAINTAYGHSAGDAALCSFSRGAMDAIRGSDLVGRLGGDEFGLMLSVSSEQNAEGLAHLLHQRLTTTLIKTGLPLSCSMGALIVPPRLAHSEADLFNNADLLMRQAKGKGRSMVVIEPVAE